MELLVTISIIALLAALLLPTLKNARGQGQRIACQSHLHQLGLAIHMYTADNDGRLPENQPGGMTNCWVAGNMILPKDATNQMYIRQSQLFPYANQAELYRCPADLFQTNGALRVRSYSMNGWVGTRYMQTAPGIADTRYRTFLREGELAAAGAALIWLLIDEHELSINDAWFYVTMDDSRPFASFPATRHEQGYNLNFGDGHVELLKLRDHQSLLYNGPQTPFSAQNLDWLRLKQDTTVR